MFPSTKDAPRIAVAALEAEAFLVWPRLELRRIARKLGLAKLGARLRRSRCRSGDARGRPRSPACRARDRCLVMGVVNVTPDSFSDGGQWFGADAAIKHGLDLAAQGADIVDVGGESTRPGAQRVSEEEELRRIGPVVTELVRAGVPISIDTMRASVAEFALDAGAQLVNDVSGGLADPQMPRLVAAAGVSYVVVHWRGHSHDMYSRAVYADVVGEVRDELARRVDAVVAAGVDPGRIVVDPGLGFGKRPEHNWPLLARLADIGRARRAHLPGPGRGVQEAVPRPPAGRSGRHAAAVRRQRRGHRGDLGAGRRGGRLVRPRAPGTGQRRRGAGGGRLARRRPGPPGRP